MGGGGGGGGEIGAEIPNNRRPRPDQLVGLAGRSEDWPSSIVSDTLHYEESVVEMCRRVGVIACSTLMLLEGYRLGLVCGRSFLSLLFFFFFLFFLFFLFFFFSFFFLSIRCQPSSPSSPPIVSLPTIIVIVMLNRPLSKKRKIDPSSSSSSSKRKPTPPSPSNVADLGLPPPLQAALSNLEIGLLSPLQRTVIPALLAGRDVRPCPASESDATRGLT